MVRQDWRTGVITPEAVAALRARIGESYPVRPWVSQVTADAIWHFTLGLGDDNPLWLDESYASQSPFGGLVAPPAFLYASNSGPVTGQMEATMGLKYVYGMWGSDEWDWLLPIREGDRLGASCRFKNVRELEGRVAGPSIEVTREYTIVNQDGATVARYRKSIIQFERDASRTRRKYAGIEPYRYSPEEIAAIEAQYSNEATLRRGATPRFWEDVAVGDQIGPMVKGPLTITGMVGWVLGYGSVLCMTNRLLFDHLRQMPADRLVNHENNIPDTLEANHYDAYYAKLSGIPSPYDFGPMRTAWTTHLLTDWMGDHGQLRHLRVELRNPNLVGDTTWLRGSVTNKRQEEGRAVVDCETTCTNQRGTLTAKGISTVELPLRSQMELESRRQ